MKQFELIQQQLDFTELGYGVPRPFTRSWLFPIKGGNIAGSNEE